MHTTNKRNSAFTLIELLVVIAIIAILAAILFPVFAQAKLAAKKAVDLSNFKQVELGTMMYMNDYDDVYPLLRQGHAKWGCNDVGNQAVDCQQVDNAAVATYPYVKNRQVWASPNDTIFRNDCPSSGPNNPGGTLSYTYNANAQNTAGGFNVSPYGLGLVGWEDNYASGKIDVYSTVSLAETQVDQVADTVLMYPYYSTFSYWNGLQAYSWDPRRIAFADASIYGIALWPQVDQGNFWCSPGDQIAIGGYGNQTNWGWADGHVKSFERSQLMDHQYVTDGPTALANHDRNKFAFDGVYHH